MTTPSKTIKFTHPIRGNVSVEGAVDFNDKSHFEIRQLRLDQ